MIISESIDTSNSHHPFIIVLFRVLWFTGRWRAIFQHPDVSLEVTIYAHQYYHHLLVTRVTARRPQGQDSGREFVFTVTNNRGDDSDDINFDDEVTCSGINIPGLTW